MKIFISYSRKDYDWVKKLHIHLSPLTRSGELTLLSDMDILPGQDWKRQIKNFLESADVAILVISPEYLASDFIRSFELPSLLQSVKENRTKVVPILIRKTLLPGEILNLKFLNTLSQPLASLPEIKQDSYFYKLSKTIHELASEMNNRNSKEETRGDRFNNAIHTAVLNTGGFNVGVGNDGNIFTQAEKGVNARNDEF